MRRLPYVTAVRVFFIRSMIGILLVLFPQPGRAQDTEAPRADALQPAPQRRTPRHVAKQPRPPVTFSVAPGSDRKDLSIFLERGINPVLGPGGNTDLSVFEPLCRPPCQVDLRSGTHVLSISSGARATVRAEAPVLVRRGEHVKVRYDSRLGLRITGWTLLLLGASAGGLLTALGMPLDGDVHRGRLIGGSLITVAGLVSGLWLANLPDQAQAWVQ